MSPAHCFQYVLFSLCVHLFTIFVYLVYYSDLLTSTYSNEILPEYDYIIVGAGTAGSLIAHRIETETNFTYIVLEAGAHSNALLDIPVLGPLLHGSVYDWQYQTVPQENGCYAMKDKKCHLPQGKIVGGSSKLNNMVHIRGNLTHYVEWFQGKYSEQYIEKQFEYVETEIICLDELKYQSKLSDAVLEAALELKYDNYDVNSRFGTSFMMSYVSQKNGKRWSMSDKLNPQHLVTNAFVEKVIIDNKSIARGVQLYRNGKRYKILAKQAVILSAGTLNSPKILQLSGVGPSEVLKPLEIPIIANLPVGKNLQDHVTTGLDLLAFNKSLNIGPDDMLNPGYMFQYFFQGRGPFTSPGCEVVGFLSTENNSVPDLQFMVLPVGIASDRGTHLRQSLGITDEVWNKYFVKSFDKYTATILPILLHPKSKGEVYITSKNSLKPPLIDPKYLSSKEDLEVLIQGLKLVTEFVNTSAMKRLGAYLNPYHFPGCENYELFSDIYWGCYVKHLTLTSYHPVGTCSMGSVVDVYFQIIGAKRLYICDGSVLPTLPSGNINAAIAMMANIFFETNIANANSNLSCRNDFVEYIYQVCLKDTEST